VLDSALKVSVLEQFAPGAFMRFWETGVQVRQLVLSAKVPAQDRFQRTPHAQAFGMQVAHGGFEGIRDRFVDYQRLAPILRGV
jgi:fructose 1,6-bisphosphatase